jgi:hypothetical protein
MKARHKIEGVILEEDESSQEMNLHRHAPKAPSSAISRGEGGCLKDYGVQSLAVNPELKV